jgi:hypothetical protein
MYDTKRAEMVISEFQASMRRLVDGRPDRRWVLQAIGMELPRKRRDAAAGRKRGTQPERLTFEGI